MGSTFMKVKKISLVIASVRPELVEGHVDALRPAQRKRCLELPNDIFHLHQAGLLTMQHCRIAYLSTFNIFVMYGIMPAQV
jgi:hypothetical protein